MKNAREIEQMGGFTYRGFAARLIWAARAVGQIYLTRPQPGRPRMTAA